MQWSYCSLNAEILLLIDLPDTMTSKRRNVLSTHPLIRGAYLQPVYKLHFWLVPEVAVIDRFYSIWILHWYVQCVIILYWSVIYILLTALSHNVAALIYNWWSSLLLNLRMHIVFLAVSLNTSMCGYCLLYKLLCMLLIQFLGICLLYSFYLVYLMIVYGH